MSADNPLPGKLDREEVTTLLIELRGRNPEAVNKLMPLVYDELRQMAHKKLQFERPGHTLNTTALVHEAYIRLVNQERVEWQSRTHFYAIAAQAMRRILVNYAEKRNAAKRGGNVSKVPLDESLDATLNAFSDDRIEEVIAVDKALTKLEQFNERGCRVVEYRFFGGLTHEEVAEVMGLSVITVRRSWNTARMWLRREMRTAS